MNEKSIGKAGIFIVVFLLLMLLRTSAQTELVEYNKELADSLGADDYGMKAYVLVILKTGKIKIQDKKMNDSLFAGHLQNISRLANAGKLVVAGPVEENDEHFEGIFILNVKTIAEATNLLQTDPAIKAGLLDAELYGWYGSAALPMYLDFHKRIQKKNF